MSKKYNLTTFEILQCLQKGQNSEFNKPFSGFSAEELSNAEQRLGVSLPEFYRQYMTEYGKHTINNICDRICEPSEISSTYEYLSEDIDEYSEDLEGLSDEEINEMCEENEIYRLCTLPKEDWGKITEDYILIACENQGVWNAGYLRKDLESGVKNPPIYISTNDDFITFEKVAESTEEFLKHIFFISAWSLNNVKSFNKKDEIFDILQKKNLDIAKLSFEGTNFCIDSETNELFACSVDKNKNITVLLTAQLK